MAREVRKMHQCDAECDMRHMRRSHERSRLARRASVLAKLHGKRPKVRAANRSPMVEVGVTDDVR